MKAYTTGVQTLIGLALGLFLSGDLKAQCPVVQGVSINNDTAAIQVCPGQPFVLQVDGSQGSNLPDGGHIQWFYSTDPNFNPALGQGTALGQSPIVIRDTIPTRTCGSLQPGDLTFLSFRATDPDAFSFVPLVNLAAGTRIGFVDNGWRAAGGFRAGEGVIYWTAPASGLAAGSIVHIQVTAQSGGSGSPNTAYSATFGTVVFVPAFNNFQLATAGDQIFAFCGEYEPTSGQGMTFLAAINFNANSWSADATSAQTSVLVPGLTDPATAFSLGNRSNGRFNCTGGTISGTAAAIRSTVHNGANWATGSTPYTPGVNPCTFNVATSPQAFVSPRQESFSQAFCGQTLYVRGRVQPLTGGCSSSPGTLTRTFRVDVICPDLSLSSPLCLGENITVSATGGVDYLWSTGETTSDIQFIGATATVNVAVTATMAATGCTATRNQTINLNALPNAAISNPGPLCVGSALSLEGSGGTTYLWNTGETTAIFSSTVTGNTFHQVTVTDANGCSASRSYNVTALALPSASVQGPMSACEGQVLSYGISGDPGLSLIWPDGSTASTWSLTATVDSTFTVQVSNSNGCSRSLNQSLFVSPQPNLSIAGPSQLCGGQSGTLVAVDGGGMSYLWGGGQQTSTLIVTPSQNTTYSLTATDVNGCTASATWSITVGGSTNLSISQIGCTDSPRLLAFVPGTGINYLWNNGATTSSILAQPSQNYSLTVSDANGCSGTQSYTTSAHTPLNIILDSLQMEQVRIGGQIETSASGGTAPYFYQWNTGATTSTLPGLVAASYGLTVTDANGCTTSASFTVDYEIPVHSSIFGLENSGLRWTLYPNPCQNSLFLSLNLEQAQELGWQLFDLQGRLLSQDAPKLYPAGAQNLQVNVLDLAPGLYFLQLQSSQGIETRRFIKQD